MKAAIKKFVPGSVWRLVRTAWLAAAHALDRLGPSVRSMSYCGFKLYYSPGNSMIRRLKTEPVFERELCEVIERDLGAAADPVFLDIGANLGLITLRVASKVPRARIYAFEPGPAQAGLLERTIVTNALEARVTLSTKALADSSGKKEFHVHPKRDSAKDSFADTGRGEKTRAIEVEAITLDEWWDAAGRPRVNVVKIDTEGAELLVLRGAREFLQKARPNMYLEIEPSNLKAYPYSARDIIAYLENAGYVVSSLSGERATAENIDSLLSRFDTFAARPR